MAIEWCKFNPNHKQKDPNFESILNFFLWSCPVEKTAYLAKTFSDYGWCGGNRFKVLKQKLQSASSKEIPFKYPTLECLDEVLDDHGQKGKRSFREVIVVVNPGNEVEAILRSIRNAFAHGSFLVLKERNENDYFYFLESRDPKKGYELRARIVLKSSTLKVWKDEIENGFIKPTH